MLSTLSPDAAYWLIAIWLAALGGAIGSFLNVVVYRLPAGMSLIEPGSHCPACKRPIRWSDNVPMLGWLRLRGRCRDCRAAISVRYPTVEAITAAMFLVLGLVECIGVGGNLPTRAAAASGVEVCQGIIPVERLWQICGIYVYHQLLLCTLLAALLIEYDGHRLPLRLFAPAMIGGVIAPLMMPDLRPVPAFSGPSGWEAGVIDGVAGAAAGAVLGWLACRMLPSASRHIGRVAGPACVGLFLGWQAAVVLGLLTVAICVVLRVPVRPFPALRRFGPTVCLALGTLGWILAWRSLAECFPGLG